MKVQHLFQNAATSLTLSCLLFYGAIRQVIFPSAGLRTWAVDLSSIEAISLLFLIGLVWVVAFSLILLIDRISEGRARTEVRLLFLIVGSAFFGAIGSAIINLLLPMKGAFVYYVLPIIVLGTLLLISLRSKSILKTAELRFRGGLLILFPAALVLVVQLIFIANTDDGGQLIGKIEEPTGSVTSAKDQKVLWIVFDELDFAATNYRPGTIELPAFDQMKISSFSATNAVPPAMDTKESIPSLLYGSPVEPMRAGIFDWITGNSSDTEKFRILTKGRSVVDDVRSLSKSSGVAGWYVPYERIFGSENTYGEWTWYQNERCSTFYACTARMWAVAVNELPIGNPLTVLELIDLKKDRAVTESNSQQQRNTFLMAHAERIIKDSKYDLSLIHLSVPHEPFTSLHHDKELPTYFDNLEVADSDLSRLLQKLEASGEANRTTVIVSSDHWWRAKSEQDFVHLPEQERAAAVADLRVPFIVKFGGDTQPLEYTKPFNTLITRYIISAILKGEVQTSAELSAWIERFSAERPELVNAMPNPNENWLIAGDRD